MVRPLKPVRIPIFSLEVVLLPGAALPLHIFEPRYKLMIQHCIENSAVFGVVFEHEGEAARVGCTAAIAEVVKTYEDGRSDIVTVGQRVFGVVEMFDDQPYPEATVQYLSDELRAPSPESKERLWNLCVACHKLLRDSKPDKFDPETADSLAYYVARVLPLDVELRQELLEMRSEPARQARLADYIEQWMPRIARVERIRAKAPGNGHGQY
ncbi:MAG: LON peptidase substrate-binding domain-containing protein [Candidatus Acidiferrales bacterium]